MIRFLWWCLYLAACLSVVTVAGGAIVLPPILALMWGNPWLLLIVVAGIPATVGCGYGAYAITARLN